MIKEIIHRFKQPTPIFWKKIQRLSMALGVVGTAITSGGVYYNFIPTEIVTVCFTAGLIGTFLSQLTLEDKPKDS